MNAVLSRAKAHYSSLDARRIEVPEWGEGDKPLVVTFTALTIGERSRIFRADDRGNPPDGPTACVRALILKALDEKGARLFSQMDEKALTYDVDSGVVGRIARAIIGDDGASVDLDDEKNG